MAVENINDQQFEDLMKDGKSVIVKYYADWCGSCRLFAPKFKRVSNEEDNASIAFVEVNAETNPVARKAAGVDNLPYLALFRNGQLVEGSPSSKEDYLRTLIAKV